jgi:hypothetical protein
VNAARWASAIGLAAALTACGGRRFYAPVAFEVTDGSQPPFDAITAVTGSTPDRVSVVLASRADPGAVFEATGGPGASIAERFSLRDRCGPHGACDRDGYRAFVPLSRVPLIFSGDAPSHPAALSPFTCADGCGAAMLVATDFSTIGVNSGFHDAELPRARRRGERVVAMVRGDAGWTERPSPAIDLLSRAISDWGRSRCANDLRVSGVAFDASSRDVFIATGRCDGPRAVVLRYPLGRAEQGWNADLLPFAALDPARTDATITGLWHDQGRTWASVTWRRRSPDGDPGAGSMLFAVIDGAFVAAPIAGPLRDAARGVVVLPDSPGNTSLTAAHALVLTAPRSGGAFAWIPVETPAPPEGRWVAALETTTRMAPPVALTGFDLRWYARDHRLGLWSVLADQRDGQPGAWTAAVGGVWQERFGRLGRATSTIGLRRIGASRQVAEVIALGPEVTLHSYQTTLSVIPRPPDPARPSTGAALSAHLPAATVEIPLPTPANPEDGLVLQGFSLDASPRAAGGVCLSALDVDVDWPEARRDAVKVRAAIVGGLCNDFDARGPRERHGATTRADAGVRVTLYYAVVNGRPAHHSEATVAERRAPPRQTDAEAKSHFACSQAPEAAWQITEIGASPTPGSAGALSGFTFAWDLRGFSPDASYADVGGAAARHQSHYLYAARLRTTVATINAKPTLFVDGGMTHGLHRAGLGRDAAVESAVLTRAAVTWWDDLAGQPRTADPVPDDPNLRPEDGTTRWSVLSASANPRCARY